MDDLIRPEEIQPLSFYSFYANEDDEVMLVQPAFYTGEPVVKEFHYDGGKHAILVRKEGQYILCDYINDDFRKLLNNVDEILVYESVGKRQYKAKVIFDDVERISQRALKIHNYSFKHHPYPVATKTLDVGKVRCDSCKRTTGLSYTGMIYPTEKQVTVCPKCISSGKAMERLNGFFVNPIMLLPGIRGENIGYHTLSYHTKDVSNVRWLYHCDTEGLYMGRLNPEDLNEELWKEITETWNEMPSAYIPYSIDKVHDMILDSKLAAHLFMCPKCKKNLLYVIEE